MAIDVPSLPKLSLVRGGTQKVNAVCSKTEGGEARAEMLGRALQRVDSC